MWRREDGMGDEKRGVEKGGERGEGREGTREKGIGVGRREKGGREGEVWRGAIGENGGEWGKGGRGSRQTGTYQYIFLQRHRLIGRNRYFHNSEGKMQ